MKKKILGMLLILAILFPYCEIQKNDVEAMSPPYLTENYEKDVIAMIIINDYFFNTFYIFKMMLN